ncbi:MAG: hypothetical protein A2430_02470 [Candidatus Liptonbacteria bacterium RIFOXYC1_FULL_36_8]|uniref:RNA polymerase subunit sigma-70 n=3 Tax=Candidatus Liptoniibacteriota TaxID=1817909 RepID=A0A1G2CNS1_9BACT|nr:MAG: hypothetical protein A2390_00310 [Candidatus Liptonbacteria bacterium RIFOXYB1_FULL_36_10]OGZ03279.1 MAG: hypothetical protein A2604_02830 [Candidatus Liptonbacteria bacterium RIFOXYD1_FULL_36_11]OGZ03641.1 MAG: hypothetical protein A2430_02470 [Candidatus Liptonbacteria bacterium RIFOXYC1_FULL_36_8]
MLENEEKLIKLAKSGKAESFGFLYDSYHEKIYRFIYLKVSHKEEAEDITHQVFLSAWQNIKNYSSKGFPFSSWLYQIAKNKVIDHYRSAKPKISIELVSEKNLETNLIADPTSSTNFDEMESVKKAIEKLTPEQQDVLIMRFIEDLPIKEVALTLNKTPGAVKLIQFRAVNKLKQLLNK